MTIMPLRLLPISSYTIGAGEGCVIVQAGGEIMKKCLAVNETLKLQSSCLVAFDSSCVTAGLPLSKFMDTVLVTRGFDLQITGPGDVYFASNCSKRTRSDRGMGSMSRLRGSSFALFRLFNILVFTGIVIALSRLVEVEVIDQARDMVHPRAGGARGAHGERIPPLR
jgi:hypothetical protein